MPVLSDLCAFVHHFCLSVHIMRSCWFASWHEAEVILDYTARVAPAYVCPLVCSVYLLSYVWHCASQVHQFLPTRGLPARARIANNRQITYFNGLYSKINTRSKPVPRRKRTIYIWFIRCLSPSWGDEFYKRQVVNSGSRVELYCTNWCKYKGAVQVLFHSAGSGW